MHALQGVPGSCWLPLRPAMQEPAPGTSFRCSDLTSNCMLASAVTSSTIVCCPLVKLTKVTTSDLSKPAVTSQLHDAATPPTQTATGALPACKCAHHAETASSYVRTDLGPYRDPDVQVRQMQAQDVPACCC